MNEVNHNKNNNMNRNKVDDTNMDEFRNAVNNCKNELDQIKSEVGGKVELIWHVLGASNDGVHIGLTDNMKEEIKEVIQVKEVKREEEVKEHKSEQSIIPSNTYYPVIEVNQPFISQDTIANIEKDDSSVGSNDSENEYDFRD